MKLLLICMLVCAQSCLQAQVMHRRPSEQPPDYVLGVGDQLSVHVTDMQDLPSTPVRIGPNGTLDFPLIGQVQASGLTLNQFREELSTKLSKYITSPDIAINLVESQGRPVSVVGEVSNPGMHQLVGPQRLLDVISLSGGLKPDAGPSVMVTREARWGKLDAGPVTVDPATGTTSTSFPLDGLLSLKHPEENIVIEPGDVISVPRADLIYVVGDVRKAGGFELTTHRTMSLLHAVTLAEGLGPDNSASHARIIRPAPNGDGSMSEIPIDIPKIFAGKAPDVQLFANDVLFVPDSSFKKAGGKAVDAAIGLTTGILIYH